MYIKVNRKTVFFIFLLTSADAKTENRDTKQFSHGCTANIMVETRARAIILLSKPNFPAEQIEETAIKS